MWTIERDKARQLADFGETGCAIQNFAERVGQQSILRLSGEALPQRMFIGVVEEQVVIGLVEAPQFEHAGASAIAQVLALVASSRVPQYWACREIHRAQPFQ